MAKINRILVVEDDIDIRAILVDILTEEGYTVEAAGRGKQGLEYLVRQPFGLIILDMKLPDMTGNDFLENLPPDSGHIPVIVVSANTSRLRPVPQVKSVISKPFDVAELIRAVGQNSH